LMMQLFEGEVFDDASVPGRQGGLRHLLLICRGECRVERHALHWPHLLSPCLFRGERASYGSGIREERGKRSEGRWKRKNRRDEMKEDAEGEGEGEGEGERKGEREGEG